MCEGLALLFYVLCYNAFVHSMGGVIYEAVSITSAVIGILRHRKEKKAA